MIAEIEFPPIGDIIHIAATLTKDRINPSYAITLESHRLTAEETRGIYWYRFTRTYRRPGAAIVGVQEPLYSTRSEAAVIRDGVRGPVNTLVDSTPFTILTAGRRNQKCSLPMSDGGLYSISIVEDLELRLTAQIPTASALLSTYGGYCRVDVAHLYTHPAQSPCTGLPDYSGANIMAKNGMSIPVDGPFSLKPSVNSPGNLATAGSWVVFRPARVNWEYWDAGLGSGPVVRHLGYGPLESSTK